MVATTDILQPWEERDDPFEDAILEARDEEGCRLCDAVDEFRVFLHEDLQYETFETPEELDEARRIFDGLVEQAHRRFDTYRAKLFGIKETLHGHP